VPRHLKRLGRWTDGLPVINLTRIHGNGTFFVNPDLIETIESCPDTVVMLVNKHRYIVEDTVEQVIDEIVKFRARVAATVGAAEQLAPGARTWAATTEEERAA